MHTIAIFLLFMVACSREPQANNADHVNTEAVLKPAPTPSPTPAPNPSPTPNPSPSPTPGSSAVESTGKGGGKNSGKASGSSTSNGEGSTGAGNNTGDGNASTGSAEEDPGEEPMPSPPPPPPPPSPQLGQNGFALTSNAIKQGKPIPVAQSCDGGNNSPDLTWSNPPEGTKAFALYMFDRDATYIHWVLINIPGTVTNLATGASKTLPMGTKAVLRSGNKTTYGGPCPPKGSTHRYVFTLYALKELIDPSKAENSKNALAQMKALKLGEVSLEGTFKR